MYASESARGWWGWIEIARLGSPVAGGEAAGRGEARDATGEWLVCRHGLYRGLLGRPARSGGGNPSGGGGSWSAGWGTDGSMMLPAVLGDSKRQSVSGPPEAALLTFYLIEHRSRRSHG